MIDHHPAKSWDHGHCGSVDTIVLVCHVISQGHVIKESCDFMGESSSWYVTTPPSLVIMDTKVVEI